MHAFMCIPVSIQVFKLVYCERFTADKVESMKSVCLEFAQAVDKHCPELRSKLKIHLILHLPDRMFQFGPASGFNTERYRFLWLGVCITLHFIDVRTTTARLGPVIYTPINMLLARILQTVLQFRRVCSGGHLDQSERQWVLVMLAYFVYFNNVLSSGVVKVWYSCINHQRLKISCQEHHLLVIKPSMFVGHCVRWSVCLCYYVHCTSVMLMLCTPRSV